MGTAGTAADDDVVRTVELTPDESITDAIGRGHTLASAVADIIDNSLDVQAENIRVRFVTEDDRLVAVRIRDDGTGMTPAKLQDSMTLGKQKSGDETSLGHFGIGLKAASLSQAMTLTVYSRSLYAEPCGMRIRRGSFTGEVLDAEAAQRGYEWDVSGPASTGTVVEWRGLETVNQSKFASERRAWLERTITSLLQTLGLTFHRIIQKRGIRITIDTWDLGVGSPGLPRTVEPRDPFQFNLSGHAGYPSTISSLTSDGARLDAECFVLPPRSDSPSAWLLGRNPMEWQGLYIYRNDRLLQAGGWLDVRPDDKRLRLARMRIDITKPMERHLRLRHEKNGVTPTPEFTSALEAATNEAGTTLNTFRDDAAEVYRASNLKKQSIKPAVPVSFGLPDRVVEAVRDVLGERDDDPIRIDWKMLPEGSLFELQHDRRLIRFNLGYQAAMGGDAVALVPTLVYLLLEGNFTKSRLNQVTRDQIEAWQAIASAAMLAQLGVDAYDALANWPNPTVDLTMQPRPEIMAGPRPTPPSVELRWAHLGQRGITLSESAAEAQLDSRDVSQDHETMPSMPVAKVVDSLIEEADLELLVDQRPGIEDAEDSQTTSARRGPSAIDLSQTKAFPGDRQIVMLYRDRTDVETIAATLVLEPREVAMRLAALILDLHGDDIDDHGLAAMHGMPYSPEERERIVNLYREGKTVRWIAGHYSRTPFAIAWQLLSSPKRPVDVPKNLLRRIDRALAGAPTQRGHES